MKNILFSTNCKALCNIIAIIVKKTGFFDAKIIISSFFQKEFKNGVNQNLSSRAALNELNGLV
jgi:hypothetical protein